MTAIAEFQMNTSLTCHLSANMSHSRRLSSRLIGALLIWLLVGGHAEAADMDRWTMFEMPVFHNYTEEHGLPNPIITALTVDGDGFLWVGTQGGLARWDGYRFRVFKRAARVAGALPDNWVTVLHTDPHGRLWIGTSAGGLARYDRDHDNFIVYAHGPGGLSNAHVWSIADDGDNLWVGTEGGLDHLDLATGRIESLPHRVGDDRSPPDDRILAVLHDAAGTLWVGTRNGLVRRTAGSTAFVPVPLGDGTRGEIGVGSLFGGADGRVWIGTLRLGAFVIAPDAARAVPVLESGPGISTLQSDHVFSIAAGDSGEIWLGTYGQGIVIVDSATGRTRRVVHEPTVLRSLANDTIWSLYRDRSGAMWVGTTRGLGRLENRNAAVATIFGQTSNPLSLSGTDVESVAAASDGRIWLGVMGKGIDILDPVNGKIINLPVNEATPDSAVPSMIQSFLEMPGGEMLIGSSRGVYQADAAGTRVTRLTLPGRDLALGSSAIARADGMIWVGGAADGLWAVRGNELRALPGGGTRAVPGGPGASNVEHFAAELTDQRIVTLAAGAHGDLWIGTRNGLNKMDLASRSVERILPSSTDTRSLAAGYIATLFFDGSGRLWVGTLGGGIQVLIGRDRGRPVFRQIGTDDGLPDVNVDCILADATGRIWVATDKGIASVDPITFAVQTLSHADGAALSSYWAHSGTVTAAGELLFGGSGGGLTVLRPAAFRPWEERPPLVVTDVRIGGKTVSSSSLNGASVAPLIVPSRANSVSVEFSALDYSAPEANRYAYRLDGFDTDWIDIDSTRRVAGYTNLSPGDYTLRLRGSNRSGRWTERTLDLPIRVQPFWYQTMVFKLLVTGAALACILLLVQGRTVYLRQRQRELERVVAERTAELEASKRQIEEIAYYDALTGLPNRRLFTHDIRRLLNLAEARRSHFALLLIDLDRFKQINDTLGHDVGDALLMEATKRLQAAVRSKDFIARLGGDEFAVLMGELTGTDIENQAAVEATCRRIVEHFAGAITVHGSEIKTSASLGVALCPDHGLSQTDLYKAADVALYAAKRGGRNTWRLHGSPVGVKA